MYFQPIEAPTAASRDRARDLIVAVALALILSTGWLITDWARLRHLLLPDHDDMMRLAQVRDWLAGQATNDWTQYRMAPPLGAPMHWSRVNDVGIAAIILLVRPVLGTSAAEMAAVLGYPLLLFALALFLSARIGRRLWGAQGGPIAALLMAFAYPGTLAFLPGRIDHHALQVVLIQLLVLAVMAAPTWRGGLGAGLWAGISLVVGLETLPQVGVLIAVLALLWVAHGVMERARLLGFAGGLAGTTLLFLAFLRPTLWSAAYCDAFTPASATGALLTAGALALLAAMTPWLRHSTPRLAAGGLLGGAVLAATLIAYPSCWRGPYGVMDPFLVKWFLPFIDEANSLFDQRPLRAIAFSGVCVVASLVTLWMLWRDAGRRVLLLPLGAVILVSTLVMLAQVRGVYIGAPLAAPMLAGLVITARNATRGRVAKIVGAWLASAGILYATLGDQIERRLGAGPGVAPVKQQVLCSAGNPWALIDRQPKGVVMAGTSIAAYLIAATHHATIGAGYHRNDRGNMAMYRFFLSPPERARAIGRAWRADYVAFCPGDFDELGVTRAYPASLATALARGRVPAWLRPVPIGDTALRLYRIRR
ncbi:MAG: hypothetical protein A4S12_04880 [Proteobacteria bacterium SG_bin5]|nr:hypothetical protein [Sphingomonas sp.]OQW43422.1 MAG: hypothetical protein A4S12_04880 [Proteobacteria bacterium SG_bin5]